MSVLRIKLAELVAARSAIGSMPPQPPTRRAHLGAYLVRYVRRSLFWLLPQFDRFHASVIDILEHQSRLAEEIGAGQCELEDSLRAVAASARTHHRLLEMERSARDVSANVCEMGDTLRNLEDRMSSLEQRVAAYMEELRCQMPAQAPPGSIQHLFDARKSETGNPPLERVLQILKEHSPANGPRPLLDLWSGSGEWLELLQNGGFSAAGVEENYVLAAVGNGKGLRLVAADPLAYLSSLPAECMGAVTAIRLIDCLTLPRLSAVFDQTVRILEPGGIALFMMRDPNSLRPCAGQLRMEQDRHDSSLTLYLTNLARLQGLDHVTALSLPCANGGDTVFQSSMCHLLIVNKPRPSIEARSQSCNSPRKH